MKRAYWLFWFGFVLLGAPTVVWSQMREIVAWGEYRMGDNDTRADAMKLALADAKKNALEQAGTYLSSVTEVQNLRLARAEVQAYSAGIVALTGDPVVHVALEGQTTLVRVQVRARIDTADLIRRIEALRNDKAELLDLKKQLDELRVLLGAQSQALANLTSQPDIEAARRERQQTLARADVKELLTQAWAALGGGSNRGITVGSSTLEDRARGRRLVEQALQIEPNSPEAQLRFAEVLLEEKQWVAAEQAFRAVLGVKPDWSRAYNGLGNALMDGKRGEAITAYREAIRLNPQYAIAYNNLGNALNRDGKRGEAIAAYRQAIRLDPQYAVAYSGLGNGLIMDGKRGEAIAAYRQAIRLDPQYAIAYYLLGLALREAGGRADAIEAFREFLRLTSNTQPPHERIERAIRDARRSIADLESR
jgi:tetratricopeptide (TPR) repeat protein